MGELIIQDKIIISEIEKVLDIIYKASGRRADAGLIKKFMKNWEVPWKSRRIPDMCGWIPGILTQRSVRLWYVFIKMETYTLEIIRGHSAALRIM